MYRRFGLITSFGFRLVGLGLLLVPLVQVEGVQNHDQVRITHYAIRVSLPVSEDHLNIEARLAIEGSRRLDQSPLVLALCMNFDGVTCPATAVVNEGGQAISFQQIDREICIERPETHMTIRYQINPDSTPPTDPYFKAAFGVSSAGFYLNSAVTSTDNWYPKLASAALSRLPDFEIEIDAPDRLSVIASGQLAGAESANGRTLHTWRNYSRVSDRSLFIFALPLSEVIQSYDDGFQVQLWLPDGAREENIKTISDVVHDSYTYFRNLFGGAPFYEYKIITFGFQDLYFGLFNAMALPPSLFTEEIHNNDVMFPMRSIIHEVSHSWWGNIVTSNPKTDFWLLEGFAKYSEVIAIEPVLGVDLGKKKFGRMKMATMPFIDLVPSILKGNEAGDRNLLNVSVYYGGAMLLHMISAAMGDKLFLAAVQSYVRESRGRYVGSADLFNAFAKVSPIDLSETYWNWLKKPGMARYRLWTDQAGSSTTVELENTSDRSCLALDVKVNSQTEPRRFTTNLNRGDRIRISVPSPIPNMPPVEVDPDGQRLIFEDTLKGPGGLLIPNAKGAEFLYITKGGPLDQAGVRDKMQLVDIDGIPVVGLEIEQLNQRLFRPKGTLLRLNVKETTSPVELTY